MNVRFDERLVEQAMLESADAAYLTARERVYEIADGEARNARFLSLAWEWFERLGFAAPVRDALAAHAELEGRVAACIVGAAPRGRDEGAELYVRGAESADEPEEALRRLRILVRPESLVTRPAEVRALLRRELLFVSDMLDPAFGYRPALPPSQAGPTHDRLLLDRYAAVWTASVVGRLRAAGVDTSMKGALTGLAKAFPMLDPEADFADVLGGVRPTHDAIVARALSPRGDRAAAPGSRCALCAHPSYTFVADLDPVVRERIAADFPKWRPGDPVCPQCADLYAAQHRAHA